jgi:hypothetical protein
VVKTPAPTLSVSAAEALAGEHLSVLQDKIALIHTRFSLVFHRGRRLAGDVVEHAVYPGTSLTMRVETVSSSSYGRRAPVRGQ